MSRGPGFQGSLANIDVSRDSSIDHLNIDKSPRLHGQVLAAVVAAVGKGDRTDSAKDGTSAQTPAKPANADTQSEPAKQ
jgi:hypothetical protein